MNVRGRIFECFVISLVLVVSCCIVPSFNNVALAQPMSEDDIQQIINGAKAEQSATSSKGTEFSSDPADLLTYIGGEDNYTLGENDVVQILVRGQGDFSGNFVIGPDGKIQYPYVGDVQAAGFTKTQLKEIVVEALKQYIKVPSVSVIIREYRSKFVYMMGEIGHPGKLPMKGDTITIRDAIIEAGLPTRDAAPRRVHVVKPDPTDPTYRVINVHKILFRGYLADNIDLEPGDIVVVPTSYPSSLNRFLDLLISPMYKATVVGRVTDVFE